jgi:hypothetical protein
MRFALMLSCLVTACAGPQMKPTEVVAAPEPAPQPVEVPLSSPDRWIVDADGIGYSVDDWNALPDSERNADHKCYERTQDGGAKETLCGGRLHFFKPMEPLTLSPPPPVKSIPQ